MGSLKTNIRSFRFSDEVAAILEQQEGKNLNDKFETLVLRCFYEAPKWDEYVRKMREEYQAERNKLYEYKKRLREFDMMFDEMKTAKYYLNICIRRAHAVAGDDVTQNSMAANGQLEE